jgi:hypothetical protein
MIPKEAYTIVKKNLEDGYDAVMCKDFGSYYGFFISQNNSNVVGCNMMMVTKYTRNVKPIDIFSVMDKFVTAKTITDFK